MSDNNPIKKNLIPVVPFSECLRFIKVRRRKNAERGINSSVKKWRHQKIINNNYLKQSIISIKSHDLCCKWTQRARVQDPEEFSGYLFNKRLYSNTMEFAHAWCLHQGGQLLSFFRLYGPPFIKTMSRLKIPGLKKHPKKPISNEEQHECVNKVYFVHRWKTNLVWDFDKGI